MSPQPPPSAPSRVAPLTLRPVLASYGGVGPLDSRVPGGSRWVVVIVDASAEGGASGVAVSALELRDALGHVVARGAPPFDVRLADVARGPYDPASRGAAPFGGSLAGGAAVRLRVEALLDVGGDALAKAPPTGARLELSCVGSEGGAVEVPLTGGEWATAGPRPGP